MRPGAACQAVQGNGSDRGVFIPSPANRARAEAIQDDAQGCQTGPRWRASDTSNYNVRS